MTPVAPVVQVVAPVAPVASSQVQVTQVQGDHLAPISDFGLNFSPFTSSSLSTPADKLITDSLRRLDPTPNAVLNDGHSSRDRPVYQQPIGTLASNSVATLLDVVQEVSAMDHITLGSVTSAITRPDRAAYLGIVLLFVGLLLVILDTEA